MNNQNFILQGDIIYVDEMKELHTIEQGYVICRNGLCKGAFAEIPESDQELPMIKYGHQLIMPGMIDLHIHAPQYTFRGTGMDLELLDWLQTYTFPEEAQYGNLEYAKKAYQIFTEDLQNSFTTRACIFGTLHKEATIELMNQLEQTGLITYVGKVNMDRNGGKDLCEVSVSKSVEDTEKWLKECKENQYERTFPILTPRFIPSCSDELMTQLSEIQKKQHVRVQSHLSENLSEIEWVKELEPGVSCYAQAYNQFDLLGTPEEPAIMAHCVYSDEKELQLLKDHGTYIAHCPDSNMNVSSGIAPIRTFMETGLHIGIGTDLAAGVSLSMARAIAETIQVSKLYWRLVNQDCKPLSFAEGLYLATIGGGKFFGKVGSFLPDYEFDAIIVDDSYIKSMRIMSIAERAERMLYLEKDCEMIDKYVKGKKIVK